MSDDDVINAWKYWEEQGIIKLNMSLTEHEKNAFDIEFLSIKEIVLNIKDAPVITDKYSPERIINARSNYKIKDMFEYIKKIAGREPSQTEMFTFLDWIDDYSFPPEVVILIVEDCFSRNKKDLPYLKQVAKNWYDAGVNSTEKATQYSTRHKEKWQKYSKVINFLRIGRQPTTTEEELLHKWFYTYEYSEEIVLKACERTAQTIKPSFYYIDKILTDWNNNKLKTIQEIEAYIIKHDTKKEKNVNKEYKSNNRTFNNFANRKYDTKLLKENLLKKGRGELSD
jgi:DnaD/phage-associated family protein